MNGFVRSEFDDSGTLREKGVIAAGPDKISGMITRPTLTDDDTARRDLLPAVDFDA